jgi:hypothetical protein
MIDWIAQNYRWINSIGLLFDLLGAGFLSYGLIISKKKAQELEATPYGGSGTNINSPSVQDRIKQSRNAIIGLIFLSAGFALQIFGNWPRGNTISYEIINYVNLISAKGPVLDTKEFIAIVFGIAAIVGWWVTWYLNQQLQISNHRLIYRIMSFHDLDELWEFIQKNPAPFTNLSFLSLLERVRKKFLLYGYKKEIERIESFIRACTSQNIAEANRILIQLVESIPKTIRAELKIR